MMLNKTFHLILLSLIPLLGFSQANSQYPDSGNKIRLGFQTTGDGLIWRDTQPKVGGYQPINNKAAWIILDTINNKFYHYKNSTWTLAGGQDIDTTSLSNRINLKLNIADTASMLTNYLRTGTAASTYLPLTGGTISGASSANNYTDTLLNVNYQYFGLPVFQNVAGIVTNVNTNGENAFGILSETSTIYQTAIGVKGKANLLATGGNGVAYGILGEITATAGGGSASNSYAGYFNNTSTVSDGNHYGLFVNTASGGDYGIYQTGSGINYLGSNTSIGGTLGVTGATTLNESLTVNKAGVPLFINSTNSNLNKISLQDNGTVRSYLGAGSTKLFTVANSSSDEKFSISNDGNTNIAGTLGVTSNITGNSFIKFGGLSTQFLKADGSVDGTTYLPLTGGTTSGLITSSFTNTTNYSTSATDNNAFTIYNNTTSSNNIYGGLQFLIGANSGAIPGGPGLAQIYATRAGGVSDASTDLSFSTKGAGGVLEKMRIKFDGKVGIGTTAPSYLLDVNGTLGVTGATTLTGLLKNTSQRLTGNITISDFDANYNSVQTGPSSSATVNLAIQQNVSGAANISMGGNQGGGGEPFNPNIYFTDNRKAYASIGGIHTSSGTNNQSGHIVFTTTPSLNSIALTERMRIAQDGAITMGGTLGVTSNITANSFIKSGGLSTQFLKADGSVDANTYLTSGTAAYLPLTGGTLSGSILNSWTSAYSSAPRNDGAVRRTYTENLRSANGGNTDRVIHYYTYSNDECCGANRAAPVTMYYGRLNGFYDGWYPSNNTNIIYDASVYYHGTNQFLYRAYSEVENKVTFSIKPSTTTGSSISGTKADLYLSGDAQIDRSLNIGTTLGVTGATTLSNLGGDGNRMVITNNNGLLSTQAIPTATGTVTNVSANSTTPNGLSVATGTTTPVISIALAADGITGVVSNTTQTFTGDKTFNGNVIVSSSSTLTVASNGTFGGRVNTPWLERNYANSTATSLTVSANITWLNIHQDDAVTLTLPSAATYRGKELIIKQTGAGIVSSSGTPNIIGFTTNYNGSPQSVIINPSTWRYVTLVSDGINWVTMQRNN